jgi:hypothetical protein
MTSYFNADRFQFRICITFPIIFISLHEGVGSKTDISPTKVKKQI